jgi:hypothetical protein
LHMCEPRKPAPPVIKIRIVTPLGYVGYECYVGCVGYFVNGFFH